jgi:hypothetical protein
MVLLTMDTPVPNLAESGGVAAVVLASDMDLPTNYENHAQVLALRVGAVPNTLPAFSARVPANTRVVIIGGVPPDFTLGLVQKVCARRALPLEMHRKAPALADALRRLLPPRIETPVDADVNRTFAPPSAETETEPATIEATAPPEVAQPLEEPPPPPTTPTDTEEPVTPRPAKWTGTVREFVETHGDLAGTASNAAEARRLIVLANRASLKTTVGSLTQAMMLARRAAPQSAKAAPKPSPKATPKPKKRAARAANGADVDSSTALLDQAIDTLVQVRDAMAGRDAEMTDLRQRFDSLKRLLAN